MCQCCCLKPQNSGQGELNWATNQRKKHLTQATFRTSRPPIHSTPEPRSLGRHRHCPRQAGGARRAPRRLRVGADAAGRARHALASPRLEAGQARWCVRGKTGPAINSEVLSPLKSLPMPRRITPPIIFPGNYHWSAKVHPQRGILFAKVFAFSGCKFLTCIYVEHHQGSKRCNFCLRNLQLGVFPSIFNLNMVEIT